MTNYIEIFNEAMTSVQVSVRKSGDDYIVHWHDYIANEWQENYGTDLSAALARAAVIVAGATNMDESGWGFMQADAYGFKFHWHDILGTMIGDYEADFAQDDDDMETV
jgi:hypothetical protein